MRTSGRKLERASGPRLIAVCVLAATASLLTSGCETVGATTGAVAGMATGLATTNPAVGIGVGIVVQAATDEAVKRYLRVMHADQQNLIASLAGGMAVGETRPWRVAHTLPIENGHGEVRVTRAFSSALTLCKEFAFSVADGDRPDAHADWYTAHACQQGARWQWASAEPAVERWGNLQ